MFHRRTGGGQPRLRGQRASSREGRGRAPAITGDAAKDSEVKTSVQGFGCRMKAVESFLPGNQLAESTVTFDQSPAPSLQA